MTSTFINLLVLRVADINRSAAFFASLGLIFKKEQHGNGPEHLSAVVGETLLEVYPAEGGVTTKAVRLGFSVAAIKPVIDAMISTGGEIFSPPKQTTWGLRAIVVDPDGHKIELLETQAQQVAASDEPAVPALL